MRQLFVIILFLFIFSPLRVVLADTKAVTINWNVTGETQRIQSYKMIYSYSSNMTNPLNACSTNDSTVTSLTCEGVEITSTDVYFKIIAIKDDGTTVSSNIQHVTMPVNGISIVQGFQIDTAHSSTGIYDDFSKDTATNYSFISGSMSIEGGSAHGQRWKRSIGYHTTSLGKTDQIVTATCSFNGNDYSGVAARVNPSDQTGYFVSIRPGDVTLHKFSGSSAGWVASASHSFSSPVNVELIITGNNIIVKANDTVLINTTDNTYSNGNYCGLVISRNITNADVTLDNFQGTAK